RVRSSYRLWPVSDELETQQTTTSTRVCAAVAQKACCGDLSFLQRVDRRRRLTRAFAPTASLHATQPDADAVEVRRNRVRRLARARPRHQVRIVLVVAF